jgi:hypothetical protein
MKDLAWVMLRDVSRCSFLVNERAQTSNYSLLELVSIRHLTVRKLFQFCGFLNRVYTTLKNGLDLAKHCGQNYSVHTFDQQLYAVALNMKISRPDELKSSVVRLGGFHNLCTLIACIGKIWGDGGLEDILCDSSAYGPNTFESIQFNSIQCFYY